MRQFIRSIILDILGICAKPAAGIHILNGHRIALCNPNPEIFCSQLKVPVLLKSKLQVMAYRLAAMAFLEGLAVEDLPVNLR
jgi:hypothetical protein